MRQAQALTVMVGGANVFLTGAPGAGKTYILRDFINRSKKSGKSVSVTASTGIAASHIGGNTIHSWSGLGISEELNDSDLKKLLGSSKLQARYNSCDILIIDEISMLHGKRLDMLNKLSKAFRENNDPFGGIQVILVGDLFQLPPVSRNTKVLDFVHLSDAWNELRLSICYLDEQHRQNRNDSLLIFLESMRDQTLTDDSFETIIERMNIKDENKSSVTKLYSHNVDVDSINDKHLAELPGKVHSYEMESKGSKSKITQLSNSILSPEILSLKIDAEVMFVVNNFSEGYVNGTRGRVIGFDQQFPVVELTNGKKVTVTQNTWSLNEDGLVRAQITQLPIRLAWAITIHKSQGMSLDAAQIDLSKTFTYGMGYVALSRVRSIGGLYINGANRMAFQLHPDIFAFDISLRQRSAQLANVTEDISEETEVDDSTSKIKLDAQLFSKLREWRLKRSKKDKVPPYIIFHNVTLETLASTPKLLNEKQLLSIHGISAKKVEKYGDDIIGILAEHFSV